jgi:acetyltransferase-like isoleucine patch superfamily enzyme
LFRKNIRIGKGLRLYRRWRLYGKGPIRIGDNCRVDGILGDTRQYTCIDTGAPSASVDIGDNARLYAAKIWSQFSIRMGNDVFIEESSIVDTDFHSIDRQRTTPDPHETLDKNRIVIGDRVCIGSRSIVTKRVTIGDDAMVAPGSIVARSVPAGCVVGGNPAKIIEPDA